MFTRGIREVSDDNKVRPWFQHGMSNITKNFDQTLPKIFLVIVLLFFSKVVFSASYTGIIADIFSTENEVRVQVKINSVRQLVTLQVQGAPDLKLFGRLEIGDYIAFQAQAMTKKNEFKLLSVDYVGLKSLLAVWTGDDGLCYHFSNFSQMTVYEQDRFGTCLLNSLTKSVTFPKTFKYFITPNESSWDILVGDRDLYFSAEFNFENNDEIFARIFDTDSGKVNSELTLWR